MLTQVKTAQDPRWPQQLMAVTKSGAPDRQHTAAGDKEAACISTATRALVMGGFGNGGFRPRQAHR